MTTATQTHTEEFVQIAGGRTQLRKGGKGDPLLVIHGELWIPGWTKALQELAQKHTVYAPSLPGYGQTPRLEWMMYIADLESWITWFAREQKIKEPFNVIGFSMGGWMAANIASVNSAIFKKMVLVNPMGIKPQKGEIWDYFLNQPKAAFTQGFTAPDTNAEYQQYYGKQWTPEEVEQVEINREMSCRIAWKPYMWNHTTAERAKGIITPTLVVAGRDDKITPVNCAEIYHKNIKGSQLKLIDGAGHMPEMEKTTEFVKIVNDFLAAK